MKFFEIFTFLNENVILLEFRRQFFDFFQEVFLTEIMFVPALFLNRIIKYTEYSYNSLHIIVFIYTIYKHMTQIGANVNR